MSLRHENEKLAAGRVEWLGVWASELAEWVFFHAVRGI
jgi:meiotic recombination protein SPO11